MAAYFGARTPVQTFVIKVRWMIGGMLTLILLLIGSLVHIAFSQSGTGGIVATQVAEASVPEKTMQAIFVPKERIEAGTRLEERLFTTISTQSDMLLPGTIVDLSLLRDRYAKKMLEPGVAIFSDAVASEPPYLELPIPPGYRAITITGNAQELVEGFVRAGSRVDVLWRYTDSRGIKKIATIVHAVRVMSVGQNTNPQAKTTLGKGQTTVSLIVSEQDSKEIELARSEGGISLALLGETGMLATNNNDPGVTSLTQILKNHGEIEAKLEPVIDGTMISYDPSSGVPRKFVLIEGTWRLAKSTN